jgi:hypothetical protein
MVVPAKGESNRHESPYPRDNRGAKPWRTVISSIRPSMAMEALEKVLETSEGELTLRQKIELVAAVAVKLRKNLLDIRQEIVDSMQAANKSCSLEIKELKVQAVKLQKEADKHWKTYVSACTQIGMEPKEDASSMWAENEPKSLEELAGEHNMPDRALAKNEEFGMWTGIIAATAQGGLLTLGLLGMKGIALDQIGENPGTAVGVFALCTATTYLFSQVFRFLGTAGGDHLARLNLKPATVTWIAFLLPMPACFLLGYGMETIIDGYGMMKALDDAGTMDASQGVSRPMIWLMGSFVSMPVLAYYSVKYFHIGYYRVFRNRLLNILKELRIKVDKKQLEIVRQGSRALQPLLEELSKIKEKVVKLESKVRNEFTKEELNRLEDLEETILSHDLALVKLLGLEEDRKRKK